LTVDLTIDPTVEITGQPVSRTQASGGSGRRRAMRRTVERTRFQWGVGPFACRYQRNEAIPPANILIPLERQLIALQLCRWQFLYNETLQQTSRPLLSKVYERRQI